MKTIEVNEHDLKMIINALKTMESDYCTTDEEEQEYIDLINRLMTDKK